MKYDLTGQRFGKLIAICENGKNKHNDIVWKCQCDCGNSTIVPAYRLISGKTRSCGCLREVHKMAKSRLYNTWHGMKQRCDNASDHEYKRYGGRGIKLCEEWQMFEPFMQWALSHGYNDTLTIDRIDNNGDYSPENCRWITLQEQQRNKSDNISLTYNGETHILMEWSEITGIRYQTLQGRYRRGWDVQAIITTPVNKKIFS